MRILFMGTPEFAVEQLRRLVEMGHEICGVFTQPDKPKNRGMKLAFSPVKEYALTQGLEVYQPTKMRDGTALAIVEKLQPELTVVAAYRRWGPSTYTPPSCPNTGGLRPSTGLFWTAVRKPALPLCTWPRSWTRGILSA